MRPVLMPINMRYISEIMCGERARNAFEHAYREWQRMTPEQRKREGARQARERERLDKHLKWLDYCAEHKIHPKG